MSLRNCVSCGVDSVVAGKRRDGVVAPGSGALRSGVRRLSLYRLADSNVPE